MRILLDTCEFLWLVAGDAKLSPDVAAAVRDPQNAVLERRFVLGDFLEARLRQTAIAAAARPVCSAAARKAPDRAVGVG